MLCQNSDEAIDTKKELAKVSGVSHDTIQRGEKILKSDNKEITEKVKSGKMSINEGYNRIKRKEKKVEAKNSINEVSKISGKYRIILADPRYLCNTNVQ